MSGNRVVRFQGPMNVSVESTDFPKLADPKVAAKHLQRSVRVVMTRQQMFTHAHSRNAFIRSSLAPRPQAS
jgi:hypothetical protein